MLETINIGRCRITEKLVFVGEVIGGGTGGPGKVRKQTGYLTSIPVYWFRDDRSGSKRSGSCAWQLEADNLYEISDVAVSSRSTETFYISTFDDALVELSREEFNAERARRWPLEREEAIAAAARRRVAEEERMKREAVEAEARRIKREEEAELRRIENEALKELNEEKAAEIAEKGQPVEEGLPELTGTPKQIAYAISIRNAFRAKHVDAKQLKTATTAKYWIENHRSVLFNR